MFEISDDILLFLKLRLQNFNLCLLISDLFILGDYADFLVCDGEAYLFSGGEEVFCFDLVDVCLSCIFHELYKLRCGV